MKEGKTWKGTSFQLSGPFIWQIRHQRRLSTRPTLRATSREPHKHPPPLRPPLRPASRPLRATSRETHRRREACRGLQPFLCLPQNPLPHATLQSLFVIVHNFQFILPSLCLEPRSLIIELHLILVFGFILFSIFWFL